MLTAEGALDRPALGARVFGHPDRLAVLNALVHPQSGRVAAALRRSLRPRPRGPSWSTTSRCSPKARAGDAWDLVIVAHAPAETRVRRGSSRVEDSPRRTPVRAWARSVRRGPPGAGRRGDRHLDDDGCHAEPGRRPLGADLPGGLTAVTGHVVAAVASAVDGPTSGGESIRARHGERNPTVVGGPRLRWNHAAHSLRASLRGHQRILPVRRSAAGHRRSRGPHQRGRDRRGAARRHRNRQVGDHRLARRAGAASDPGARAQQDPRGAACERVPRAHCRTTPSNTSCRTTTTTSPRPTCRRPLRSSRKTARSTPRSNGCVTRRRTRCCLAATSWWSRRSRASTASVRRGVPARHGRPAGGGAVRPRRAHPQIHLDAVQPQRRRLPRAATSACGGRHDRDHPGLRGVRHPHRDVRCRDRGALHAPSELTGDVIEKMDSVPIFPASHYVAGTETVQRAIGTIEHELDERLKESSRRTSFSRRSVSACARPSTSKCCSSSASARVSRTTRVTWTAAWPVIRPHTLLDFFPDDFLLVIDESHVTVPQIGAMYEGDASRKRTLVEHGFRLPSAMDNRPLRWDESHGARGADRLSLGHPGRYEMGIADGVVERSTRPDRTRRPRDHRQTVEGRSTTCSRRSGARRA